MRNFLPLVVFGIAAFAGCVTEPGTPASSLPTPTDTPGLPENSMEGYVDPFIYGGAHDHSKASDHNLGFHTTQLGHDPMGGNVAKSSGAHVVDIRGDWLFVGAYGLAADVQGGVYIYDIKAPEAPVLVGHYPMLGNVGGDRAVEATDDANWIVVGTEAVDCAGHVNPFGPGLYLIDARNKALPVLADYVPGSGVHSVTVFSVGERDIVVTLGAGVKEINKATGKFESLGGISISHDSAFFQDPLTDKPLLYVTGNTNLKVLDFTDPAAPEEIAAWDPPEDGHYMHQATMDVIEGRRIVIMESEDWGGAPSPFWVIDMTDFAEPELLATFTNLAGAPANSNDGNSLAFSTHNPRFENGILYLSHYHAGAWIFDLRTLERAAAPQIMGYFLPHDDNGGYYPRSSSSAAPVPNALCGFEIDELPNVMDVEVKNGVVYAADVHTGLYTFKYDAGAVAP